MIIPKSKSMILPKNEVTSFKLANILENAFLEVTNISEDGFLFKKGKFFYGVIISQESDSIGLVLRVHINSIKYSQEIFSKAIINCNEANSNIDFVITSIAYEDNKIFLYFKHITRHDRDLNIAQFVSDIDFFEETTNKILREYFKDIF